MATDPIPLLPEDDDLHRPDTDDPWWTETIWFLFFVPELDLSCHWYGVFRQNLGVQAGGVVVYDCSGRFAWDVPYHMYQWSLPFPTGLSLRDGRFGERDSMWVKAVVPDRVFEFGHDGREMQFAARFEAFMPSLVTRGRTVAPFVGAAHVDQPGRVTGTMQLHGRTIEIDCLANRDRSWGPRTDLKGKKGGYDQSVATPRDAFYVLAIDRDGTDVENRVSMGYLLRDGVASDLVRGVRKVTRNDEGRVVAADIEAVDALGRELNAHAEVRSDFLYHAYPHMMIWCAFAHWSWDGLTSWGETQDIWTPDLWRRFIRARRDLDPE